jgi:DNA-binding transcriptional LysR family regulator
MAIHFDQAARLILFSHIVEQGSLSAAAQRLKLSRPVVSKQLAALETSLGLRLLQRTTRKLALTEAGKQVLQEAQQLALTLERVSAISAHQQQAISGSIKLSCSSAVGRMHLLPLLGNFIRRYPQLDINLQLEDRFVDLIDEQVDLAIRIGHLPDSSLVARHLGQLSWQLCASPAYLARCGTPKIPADLVQHQCLFYRNAKSSMNTWEFISSQGVESVAVSGALSINDASALVTAALDGLGILLIDRAMLGDTLRSGKLIPLLPNYPPAPGFPVYAVYPARNFLPAKTRALVGYLQQHLAPLLV